MQETTNGIYATEPPEFITVTCLEWKHVLSDYDINEVIIGTLRFLSKAQRITVSGFVIMFNHLRIISQILEYKRMQCDFLRFTLI